MANPLNSVVTTYGTNRTLKFVAQAGDPALTDISFLCTGVTPAKDFNTPAQMVWEATVGLRTFTINMSLRLRERVFLPAVKDSKGVEIEAAKKQVMVGVSTNLAIGTWEGDLSRRGLKIERTVTHKVEDDLQYLINKSTGNPMGDDFLNLYSLLGLSNTAITGITGVTDGLGFAILTAVSNAMETQTQLASEYA